MPRFLVVVKPDRPTSLTRRGHASSWTQERPVSVTWVEAERHEDAADKVSPIPGSEVYVAEEADVSRFRRPETPALERI